MKFFKRLIRLYLFHFHLYPHLSILQSLPLASTIKTKTLLSISIHDNPWNSSTSSILHAQPPFQSSSNQTFPISPFQIHKPVTLPYKPYIYSTLSILFLSLQLDPNCPFLLPSFILCTYPLINQHPYTRTQNLLVNTTSTLLSNSHSTLRYRNYQHNYHSHKHTRF